MAFTPHEDTAVDVCFENIASEGMCFDGVVVILGHAPGAFRSVELDVDIGSAGFDYNALQKSEVHPTRRFRGPMVVEFETD